LDLDQLSDDGELIKILMEPGVIGNHDDWIRHLIVSNASQTGDVPHIAAAMARDPLTDVLIVYPQEEEATMKSMVATYENAVRHYPVFSQKNLYTSLRSSRIKVLLQEPGTYLWYPALIPDYSEYGPLGPPTWRSDRPEDEHIYTYVRGDGTLSEYKMMYVGGRHPARSTGI
jgi:hypothetical protein